MKNKKIILVTHSLSRTGAPQVLVNLSNLLVKDNFSVIIYNINSNLLDLESQINKKIRLYNYSKIISKLKLSKNFIISFLFKIISKVFSIEKMFKNIIVENRPDLIIFNTIFHQKLSVIANKKKIPSIRYIHELDSITNSILLGEKNRFIKSNDDIWVCSDQTGKSINKNFAKKDYQIMYPLVKIKNNILKNKKSDIININSAGDICYRKGFDLWIDTAIIVCKQNKNIIFNWFGNKGLDGYYESQIQKIPDNLKKQIIYHGVSESLIDNLSNGHLFFLSSREDPFPIVCIESLASGVPIIGFESGGIDEHKKNEVAVVVKNFDINLMAIKILKFASNKLKISSNKCKKIYLNNFEEKKVYSKMLLSINSKILK